MLNVLYLDHTAKLSGGEIALARLLQAMAGQVNPLVVIAEDGPLVEKLRGQDVEVLVEPLSAGARDVRKDALNSVTAVTKQVATTVAYAVHLRRLIKKRQINVVHTNSLKSGFYGGIAARLAGVPCIWHLRDRIAPDYLPRVAVYLTRLAITLLPTRVICNSRATMATIAPEASRRVRRRVRVVPSAVPIADPLAPPPAQQPGEQRPASRGLRIGMVGRIAPWKGQHVAIQAFAAAGLDPESRLVLLGSPMFGEHEYEATLRKEISRLHLDDRVELHGFVDDVFSELRTMDALVHASLVPEPFGQVIVEGLAAGVPVVATSGGGPSEIITDKVDGLLYPPGDVSALAGLLKRLEIDVDLRRALNRQGLQRAADYSPPRIASAVRRLYEEVSASKGPSLR